jgi:hypothetical protein
LQNNKTTVFAELLMETQNSGDKKEPYSHAITCLKMLPNAVILGEIQ